MNEITLEKEVTKLEKFLKNEGRQDFIDEMRTVDLEALDAKILNLAKHRQEILNTRANDAELERAKEVKKDLEAPYKEQLKMNEKLTRFVSLVMKDRNLES